MKFKGGDGGKAKILFVLGGPGSGKETQCDMITENFRFLHLSAGELLRAEIRKGTNDGVIIDKCIREGKIVPVSMSLSLLRR